MKAQVQNPEATICDACSMVPLSILALDFDEPTAGWSVFFRERGIEPTEDDLGRPAIRREDARAMMVELREWEFKSAEETRRRQEELVRESRPVLRGIPRPAGADAALTAYEVQRGADADAERFDPHRRLSPHEEFLTRSLGRPAEVVEEG
jgi:hypothetical protein